MTRGLSAVEDVGEQPISLQPMKSAAMNRIPGLTPGKTSLKALLHPNGECSIWKEKTYSPRPVDVPEDNPQEPRIMSTWRLFLECPQVLRAIALSLGLSPHPNFDKLLKVISKEDIGSLKPKTRYGLRGITSYGARRVRNGAYLIQRSAGNSRTVFATCTAPDLPREDMGRLHERWHEVVDTYRRKMARLLKHNGLSGEMVTVSEVQTKRYERTGVPVLHIHSVFVGKTRSGQWAITTEAHDDIWRDAISTAVGHAVSDVRSACNLQRVKKDAGSYLGKYMSKGGKAVSDIVASGYSGWLPKQWWSMTRSLAARIDEQTHAIDEFGAWLNDVADVEGSNVWLWHRDVQIEVSPGDFITIAKYGRLSASQTAQLQQYCRSAKPRRVPP